MAYVSLFLVSLLSLIKLIHAKNGREVFRSPLCRFLKLN